MSLGSLDPLEFERPFEVDFDKCFGHEGPAPYLFTFSGPVSGDVSGSVDASVLVYIVGIEPKCSRHNR